MPDSRLLAPSMSQSTDLAQIKYLEAETRFLNALDLCDRLFVNQCNPSTELTFNTVVEQMIPLLRDTEFWLVLLDQHWARVAQVRSQLQPLIGTAQPGNSCCANQTQDCPQFCYPLEQAQLLLTLLSV